MISGLLRWIANGFSFSRLTPSSRRLLDAYRAIMPRFSDSSEQLVEKARYIVSLRLGAAEIVEMSTENCPFGAKFYWVPYYYVENEWRELFYGENEGKEFLNQPIVPPIPPAVFTEQYKLRILELAETDHHHSIDEIRELELLLNDHIAKENGPK